MFENLFFASTDQIPFLSGEPKSWDLEDWGFFSNLGPDEVRSLGGLIYCGYSKTGLLIGVFTLKEREDFSWPADKGDLIDLFIHTRPDHATATFDLYSHHFILFPKEFEGSVGREVTKFKGSRQRALANPKSIHFTKAKIGGQPATIYTIPFSILFGYNPESTRQILMAARIRFRKGEPICFPSYPFSVGNYLNPELWQKMEFLPEEFALKDIYE